MNTNCNIHNIIQATLRDIQCGSCRKWQSPEKLEQIKESYFGAKKPEVKEEISDEQPATPSEVVSESMTSYVQQLAKRL